MDDNNLTTNTSSVITLLKELWRNEKLAPNILPINDSLLSTITDLLIKQDDIIEEHASGDSNNKNLSDKAKRKRSKTNNIMDLLNEDLDNGNNNSNSNDYNKVNETICMIKQIEVDRIRYMLRSYLRTRLFKIEKHVFHIIASREVQTRLSTNELHYAKEYFKIYEQALNTSLLDHIKTKADLNLLDAKEMAMPPNMSSYLFFKAKHNMEAILDDLSFGQTGSSLAAGEICLIQYDRISNFLLMSNEGDNALSNMNTIELV